MKRLFVPLFTLSFISAGVAQERTAAGAVETQMTWSALSAKADAAKNAAHAVGLKVNQVAVCGRKGMLYAPEGLGVDGEGCKPVTMPDPAQLKVHSHTQTLCHRMGNHTLISACPSGQRLMGCGGGPGDQDESNEYWVLMPDFQNNRCVGYVGNPACYDNGWSRTMVTAICYQP